MQWIKASSYRIKSINDEKFFVAVQKKLRHSPPTAVREDLISRGCLVYDVDDRRQEAMLDFLNARGEKEALDFTKKFGPLGLYWYYDGGRNDHIPLKAYKKPLDDVYWGVNGDVHKILRQMGIEQPSFNNMLNWLDYREPVEAVTDEAGRFALYLSKLTREEAPNLMTLPAEVGFLDGKPYWIPQTVTLIEYLYAWLPVLLAGGLTIKQCENEKCGNYFVGRRRKHCKETCKNAQNQREKERRETIMRRLWKGVPLEEATAGYDMKKIQEWLKKGLIYLPKEV